MNLRIYHNPRCSKSRATLALLEERGLEPEIVPYLDAPPSTGELRAILDRLDRTPRELLRTGESVYRELGLGDRDLDDDVLIQVMCRHPILMERPIVVAGDRAAVGRPPESVLEIL